MASILRHVSTNVVIDGQDFPVLKWSVALANQGTMGTASAEGALSDLIDSGVDIIQASQGMNGAEFDVYAGYDGDSKLIFSGVVDTCDIDWDDDKFEVKGRDHSASLADGKQTVADLNYKDQTIGQIVQQIADKFGFQANVTDPGIKAGVEMNGQTTFNPHPQTYWNLLQSLAERANCECYMLPDQTLYFGPEQEQGQLTVNYGAEQGSGAENPGWGLTVAYNPRNNSNITVKALSENTQTTKKVLAKAEAKPVNLGKGRKTQSTQTGSNSKVKYPKAGSSGSKAPPKTVHYIRCTGMTQEQAQQRCQAVADNLAKHQIILGMSIEGNPDVKIHSTVTLKETTIDLYGFDGIQLNVSEVTHSFNAPSDGGEASSHAFTTSFRATAQVSDS